MLTNDHLRTVEFTANKDFLKTLIEEKIEAFGFRPDDEIVEIEIPSDVFIKVKFKKEKEGRLTIHDYAA